MTILTLTADNAGVPHVDVLVQDLESSAASLDVIRTAGGREFKVRGLVDMDATAGVVTGRDYEAPFGVESSYRVQYFDAAGESLGFSDPETVTLTFPAGTPTYVGWFHNAFDPSTSVRVEFRGQGMRELVRPNDVEYFRVPGRSVGLAVYSGRRRGFERLVLDCVTATAADEARFDALFGGYDDDTIPIVCVRSHPATRFPPTLFAHVGSPARLFPDGADLGEQMWWAVTGDEVAPPPEAFVMALLDYADFTAFHSDYAAFTAAYADYTEATRDYSIAGVGD